MKKRILGIFGNVANAGQERANTDVYSLLAGDQDYELLVLVNDRGFKWHLQHIFEANNIHHKKIRFPWGIYKTSTVRHILQWMLDIIANNIQFIYNYIKFRPDYIHIGNEYMYKTLIVPLSLCKEKINFRIGDRPLVKPFYNKWLWRLIVKKVNAFIFDTNYIKHAVEMAGRDIKPIDIVLYHPAPRRKIKTNQFTQHKNRHANDSKLICGYVGQIKESKGVGIIIETAKELLPVCKNLEFWFAGNFNNEYYTSNILPILESMPLEIRDRIKFFGQIEDIDGFFQCIDIHLAPSIAVEAYGLVVVEAKKNSKPSIIFNSGGMPELITNGCDGYICDGKNPTSLINQIIRFVHNPISAKDMGLKAFESLEQLGISYLHFRETWKSVYN